ncbi:SHOCT domain-containing protein [Aquisalimonas lutea]|uniref:SHOCT domain-containing protein n=1 Tax=Aquisalimonas lutea TaxID=1327750 RepID=UPI0025B54EE2|nr:SHOCT domain-containing protein [Aquisalimonas lutea]MDN3519838.1 SHOCT domain-containing protein [Aquisalimonas lutea]
MHSIIHDTGAGFWLGHSLMVIIMITVLALILAGTYLLLSALLGRRHGDGEEPLQALAERYARGDIERDEFLKRQQDLLDLHSPRT